MRYVCWPVCSPQVLLVSSSQHGFPLRQKSIRTMRYNGLALAIALSWIACEEATGAQADSIAIKVIDDNNSGVYSRVYYNDGTQPPPFSNTDQNGEVPKPPLTCGKMRTLHAHPYDTGAYFDSPEEPCGSKITLRVLSRQTPKGTAVEFKIVPVTLPDGLPGVITWKAALDSKLSDVNSGLFLGPECDVELYAYAEQQAFKVEGEKWVGLAQATTPFSKTFVGAKLPDQQTVRLLGACDEMNARLRTLKAGAADKLGKSVVKGSIKMNDTFRSLGFEHDLKLK